MMISSPSSPRKLFTSRPAWIALILVVVALLVIGTNHPQAPSAQQRIDNLEGIIKCPACATASLAQSETVSAIELKATIAKWVHEGVSDQIIEQRVVATFGTDELLQQSNPLLWIIPSAVVGLGLIGLLVYLARRRTGAAVATGEDEALVAELLERKSTE